MNKYYDLLKEKQVINHNIKNYKEVLNTQYIASHRNKIKFLDIALICMIVFNFGAIFLTELMVVKNHADAGETTQIVEANPIMAQAGDYKTTPAAQFQFKVFVRTVFIWAILASTYYYFRNNIISDEGYYILFGIVTWYVFLTFADVVNNLGIYIGQVMFF